MPRVTWTQHNFNGGEWTRAAFARSDIAKYKNGLALCRNYVPLPQGGLTRRPGTAYVAGVKDSTKRVRLIPFEYSITQAYVLEFGHNYIRFYTNDGRLESSPGVAYEVTTTYTESELDDIGFAQSADVLYLVHRNHPPAKLVRGGSLSWTLSTLTFDDGPYLPVNTTSNFVIVADLGPPNKSLEANSTLGINDGAGFLATDVGRAIRVKSGASWGWGRIATVTDSTHCTVAVVDPIGTSATTTWRLGLFSTQTNFPLGFPSTVVFHQDRLVFGGVPSYPSRIDGSVVSDYTRFSPSATDGTVTDANAVSFTLNSTKVNAINWMVSDEWGLLAGSASAEWLITPNTSQAAVTATNVNAKPITHYGSTGIVPLRVGKSTLFVQRAKRKLREISYQFTLGTFNAPDISLVSEHLTTGGLRSMSLAQQPYPIVWMNRVDGTLVALSYDKDQEVTGWHQHQMGGYSDAGQTLPPLVESVCVIPSPDIDRDELWVAVQRYINGATVRTVERMTKFWEDGDDLVDAFFVDCGATYDGSPTTTISGLTWLKGQTVKVLADGSVHPDCVVSSAGAITLNRSASKVSVGLGYTSEAQTLPIDAGSAEGSAQGKLKRIHRVIFRFFQSVGLLVRGSGSSAAYPVPFRTGADNMGAPVPLFTGDMQVSWEGTYERAGQVYFAQGDPLPQNITMLSVQLETQDGG